MTFLVDVFLKGRKGDLEGQSVRRPLETIWTKQLFWNKTDMAPTSKREETPDRWINLQPSQNIYPLHDGPGQVPGWQAGSSREAHGNETRPIASHESAGCAQPSLCCQADEPTLRKNVARTMMAWGKASYKSVRMISPPALPAVNTHLLLLECCTRNKRRQNSTLPCNHPLMASLPSVGELSYLNNQQPGIWKRASDSGFCLGETLHFCQLHACKYEQYEFPSMIQCLHKKE